jgi:light-independent protochlorophyllide reductase subunit B
VISAPVHVQDFPARYSPIMGFEGANVLFDTLIHPLVMGLEEHLLAMFREDFEFHDAAGASHHGAKAVARVEATSAERPLPGQAEPAPECKAVPSSRPSTTSSGSPTPKRELKKIPFFVRGKARRNTETFAIEKGIQQISVETLYEAKAHYAR